MVDTSLPVGTQTEQITHWLQYLKNEAASATNIFLIGNKEDLINKQTKTEVRQLFKSMKEKGYIQDFCLASAKTSDNINTVLDILRNKCTSLLKEDEYFMIPVLYKEVAELVLKYQAEGKILIGKLCDALKDRFRTFKGKIYV